jgi:hypothetical protein
MDADPHGKPDPAYRTEIRTRWTARNLYFLFVCPYEKLNLKPNPNRSAETYELWNWDVAEVFIGDDFSNIRRYKERQLSCAGTIRIDETCEEVAAHGAQVGGGQFAQALCLRAIVGLQGLARQ